MEGPPERRAGEAEGSPGIGQTGRGGAGGVSEGSEAGAGSNLRPVATWIPDTVGEAGGKRKGDRLLGTWFCPCAPVRCVSRITPSLQQGKRRLTAAGRGTTGSQFNLNAGVLRHRPLNGWFPRPRLSQALP